jgi:arginine repressor
MADQTLKSMIEQMEKRYQDLSIKLEAYRDIHAEMTTLARAIKVLKGEKLTPGRVSAPDLAAGPEEEETDYLQPPRKLAAPRNDEIRPALRQLLKANPKGMTTGDIAKALNDKGFSVTNASVHNTLRSFNENLKITDIHGSTKKLYALTKEG